ncbi:MAG: cupin domain-containing protein [Phycisphaerae bacterium]
MAAEKTGKPKIPPNQVFDLAGLVEYGEGAVVSRTLAENRAGTVTLFAFDADQGLSEHTAPFDALVQVVEGEGEFIIGGKSCQLVAGQIVLMPANIPHAVRAPRRFKMLLTMLRTKGA